MKKIFYKIRRMRILGACIFLSFLAGNWGLEREKLDKEK